ncbi:MAG TPA: carbon-nitrogen hydrolase family protein [Phycisphaerae bacterium]|nr:carbon-nitrogen hydrolase family protein [Phycisphaerae bacterium]
MSQKITIGVAAISMEPVSIEQRRRDIVEMITRAAAQRCQLVCFPEFVQMQRTTEAMADVETGCDDVYARYAEPAGGGPTSKRIAQACQQHGIWTMYGITERWPDGHATNSMVLTDASGQVALRHAKTHLAPGEDGEGGISPGGDLQPLSTPFGRIGVMTCYEIYFPEVARVHQAKGADWFFYPHADNQPKCLDIARVRAFDSRMPLIICGYVWPEKSIDDAPTGAVLIDAQGDVVARSENQQMLLVMELDPDDRPTEAPRWDRPNDRVDARSFRWSRRRAELYTPLVQGQSRGVDK